MFALFKDGKRESPAYQFKDTALRHAKHFGACFYNSDVLKDGFAIKEVK